MLAVRTPPREAICFTQTGQRSGELLCSDPLSRVNFAKTSLFVTVHTPTWAYTSNFDVQNAENKKIFIH